MSDEIEVLVEWAERAEAPRAEVLGHGDDINIHLDRAAVVSVEVRPAEDSDE